MTSVLSHALSVLSGGDDGGDADVAAGRLVRQRSAVDGATYLVRPLADRGAAADRLARIRAGVLRLMSALRQRFKAHPVAAAVLSRFDAAPSRFRETLPDATMTSYTVAKGERVHMCLRQKDGGDTLVRDNVLMFVALHELAHVGTLSVGHTPEFWGNFAWLLKRAEELGVYSHERFKQHPVAYCGMTISDVPTADGGPEAGVRGET